MIAWSTGFNIILPIVCLNTPVLPFQDKYSNVVDNENKVTSGTILGKCEQGFSSAFTLSFNHQFTELLV